MSMPPPSSGWAPPGAAVAPPGAAVAPPAVAATAKAVLFDSPEQAATALAGQTDESMLASVPTIVRKAALKEVQRAILEVIDIGVSGVVQRGWKNHPGLQAAGARTSSGGREVVQLADHVINSSHSPQIAITIDGKELGTLPIAINMSLKLLGVSAVVEGGHLMSVENGSIAASANLAVAGRPVTSRTKTVDAARSIQLPKPVPLTKDA